MEIVNHNGEKGTFLRQEGDHLVVAFNGSERTIENKVRHYHVRDKEGMFKPLCSEHKSKPFYKKEDGNRELLSSRCLACEAIILNDRCKWGEVGQMDPRVQNRTGLILDPKTLPNLWVSMNKPYVYSDLSRRETYISKLEMGKLTIYKTEQENINYSETNYKCWYAMTLEGTSVGCDWNPNKNVWELGYDTQQFGIWD